LCIYFITRENLHSSTPSTRFIAASVTVTQRIRAAIGGRGNASIAIRVRRRSGRRKSEWKRSRGANTRQLGEGKSFSARRRNPINDGKIRINLPGARGTFPRILILLVRFRLTKPEADRSSRDVIAINGLPGLSIGVADRFCVDNVMGINRGFSSPLIRQ